METPIAMTFDELQGMLRPMLKEHLKGSLPSSGMGLSSEQNADVLGSIFGSLSKLLNNHSQCTESLKISGIPLPEVDEQLGPMQKEVEAALQRLAELRRTVPAVVAASLEYRLKQLRPAAGSAELTDSLTPPGIPQGDSAAQLEDANRVHQAMTDALNKLPSLRARLEDVEVRLGRNLAAVDAAHDNAAEPPRTVERVLRGAATKAAVVDP
eukprot:GHRR01023282.1.p1 GENE.GHRR01023282.1~~GHRR01023282.1.p1  ORF type:complete len:211 (+),score=65.18 GHRR01023282.1:350-982(+)